MYWFKKRKLEKERIAQEKRDKEIKENEERKEKMIGTYRVIGINTVSSRDSVIVYFYYYNKNGKVINKEFSILKSEFKKDKEELQKIVEEQIETIIKDSFDQYEKSQLIKNLNGRVEI